MIDNKKKAVIHVAKAQLGMTDEEYRDLLGSVGVKSSRDLTARGFDKIMSRMEALGFRTTSTRKRKTRGLPLSKKAIMSKLEAILLDMGLPWKYADSIAKKRFGKDAVQWLDPDELRKVLQMMIYHQKRRASRC